MNEDLLARLVEAILPEDRDPGAERAATLDYVRAHLPPDIVAKMRDGAPAELAGEAWFARLCDLAAEGFYADPGNGGNDGGVSWRMIGYEPRLPDGPAPRFDYAAFREAPPEEAVYDAIVVGAGAGGGIAASVLAHAGKRVLLLERGDAYGYDIAGKRDHLRNHRNIVHGHNTGPDPAANPRVFVDAGGIAHTVSPLDKRHHNNAAGPGSGTAIYGGQAWRFLPDDFRMATRYGVPQGSSLADWPIGYDDLAPDYARAEREIGVAGSGPDHPMPPVPGYAARAAMERGAAKLGWRCVAPPLLINTVPRDGRASCAECGSCVGFACPSDAKNGTQNTVIPRALATGRLTLTLNAAVCRIDTDAAGAVNGVSYFHGGRRRAARARAVVLSGGAIETARLLLLSGLGNEHVGRHLQGHVYPTAYGLFDAPVYDPRGPGVTLATTDFNHGNDAIVGGGMLADDFIVLPAILWKTMRAPDAPNWGLAAKDYMRASYRRTLQIRGPVQEIPNPESRVMLDPTVTDANGVPVARLSGICHPETLRTARFMLGKAEEWMRASGARRIWTQAI
ncbi:MAG: GMC family oxidoreductase N-terminal domain-containing protein, partial [Tagaea sp.]|nr:GMC family oxidoreductase N-terminal domain-containing protein [Tagaea sp.]